MANPNKRERRTARIVAEVAQGLVASMECLRSGFPMAALEMVDYVSTRSTRLTGEPFWRAADLCIAARAVCDCAIFEKYAKRARAGCAWPEMPCL